MVNKDTDPRHWKLGFIYYNPDNPDDFVGKKKGRGSTFNFGHRHGRLNYTLLWMPGIITLLIVFILSFFI